MFWFGVCAVLVAVLVFVLPLNRINVTTTASMKSRIYWLSWDKDQIKRGDVIMFEHANVATHYKKAKLTKMLACDEGDFLEVKGFKEYYCNGVYLGRAKDKSLKGEKLEHFVYAGVVPPKKMFVFGQHIDSYDSRYIGFLDKALILAKANPLF